MRPPRLGGWLAAGTATLISALALGAVYYPAVVRIPRRNPNAAPVPVPALFSHRTHGSFGCYACHPSVFPQSLVGFTHAEMREGQFCGRCHDGRTSFAIPGATCARCHVDGH